MHQILSSTFCPLAPRNTTQCLCFTQDWFSNAAADLCGAPISRAYVIELVLSNSPFLLKPNQNTVDVLINWFTNVFFLFKMVFSINCNSAFLAQVTTALCLIFLLTFTNLSLYTPVALYIRKVMPIHVIYVQYIYGYILPHYLICMYVNKQTK